MKDYTLELKSIKGLCQGVFELTLESDECLPQIRAGQFLHLKVPGFDLRRPFCIHKYNKNQITLLVANVGAGTNALCGLKDGMSLKATLPLGNGFTLKDEHKNVVLLGGGLGCAPLLNITNDYKGKKFTAVLGFKNKENVICKKDFENACDLVVCTDDGSYGFKGFSVQYLEQNFNALKPDVVLVCGPDAMAKAAARLVKDFGIDGYVSCESRMGCGVGACLVCAVEIEKDGQRMIKRACADGPVFSLKEIVL